MMTEKELTELKSMIPEDRFEENVDVNHPLGNSGRVIFKPEEEEEIQRCLEYANKNKKTVTIISGGTKRGFGGENEVEDIMLSMENYKGIVEHSVGDMTITVKAGTPFQELQDFLSQYNQKISLDPPLPEKATIGGVIAANDSGPKRLGYGSARDEVIGLRMIYPNGTIIRAGGKVVKNVAGYDMNKLFIGSMGTLGVISEITLKLRPLPKYESLMVIHFSQNKTESIKDFAIKLLDSKMEPISLELLNPTLSKEFFEKDGYTVLISLEDMETSVHYQEDYISTITPDGGTVDIIREEEARSFWKEFSNLPPDGEGLEGNETVAAVKVGVVNLDVIQMIRESTALQDLNNVEIKAHGGMGHGICHMYVKGAESDVVSTIKKLRETVTPLGGYAVAKHLPYALRKEVSVWGEKLPYHFLFEGIKKKVDPNYILNPNRFVGGI